LGVIEKSFSVLHEVLLREVLRNADMLASFGWVPVHVLPCKCREQAIFIGFAG
jgi:hypothetical protein